MQRPRDLGLGRIDTVRQGRVGPRSLDATLWWGIIERTLSSDSARFASWEGHTGFGMEVELSWWRQNWKQEEHYKVGELALVRNEADLNHGSVGEDGRGRDRIESCLPSKISGTW